MQLRCTINHELVRSDLISPVAFLQLKTLILLLAVLAAPVPAMAQYGSTYQQPKPYNPYPGQPRPTPGTSIQQRYPDPSRSSYSVMYGNGTIKNCHTYAGVTRCP